MNGEIKLGSERFIRVILFLAIIVFSFHGLAYELCAYKEPAPISGTPKLHKQKIQLHRDLGLKPSFKTEKILSAKILADTEGEIKSFYAYDFKKLKYYTTTARCRGVFPIGAGYYLNVYVEESQSVDDNKITSIKNEFISNILPKETDYFGTPYFGSPPSDGFTLLILDIQDDYNSGFNNSTYTAGYFDSRNEYSGLANSNARHMIYLDSNPGLEGFNPNSPASTKSFLGTLAHEFQHFIHFNIDPTEDTWVDEGLAGLARYVCGYGHRTSHVTAFAESPGTSLTTWNDELANYGATYLFMLYLATHYGGATTTKNIVANNGRGITGINNALRQSGYSVTLNDIFKKWVIANYLNDSSVYGGIYGYNDGFSGISTAPGNIQITSSHSLYPALGGGLVDQYAANYIKFSNLGGTYNNFILIPYNLSSEDEQSYSYTGILGSLILSLSGINDQMGMSGVQEGSSNPTPQVKTDLSENTTVYSSGGVTTSGESRGGCFIATMAYGSPLAQEVVILREFRDRYLLTSIWGKSLVVLYYKYSPEFISFISNHEYLRILARVSLYPAIGLSYGIIKAPRATYFLGLGLVFAVGLLWAKKRRS